MKEHYVGKNTDKVLGAIQFGILSPGDICKYATTQVISKSLYEPGTLRPTKHGVLDLSMGPYSKREVCHTCGKDIHTCPGHFGFIELSVPCFHVGYFPTCLKILQMICKTCGRVMLDKTQRLTFLALLQRSTLTYSHLKKLKTEIHGVANKSRVCMFCNSLNGKVRKAGLLRISHAKYNVLPSKKMRYPEADQFFDSFDISKQENPKVGSLIPISVQEITPVITLSLFQKIPEEDLIYLAMGEFSGRPEDMVATCIPLAPNPIRPSAPAKDGKGTSEDDLTMKASEILMLNESISGVVGSNAASHQMMERWYALQVIYGLNINGAMTGLPFNFRQTQQRKGLVQRLKGKQGRFRSNLSGKRVEFTARTVISPDPNLKIDQVGIPVHVAKVLTFPERVNEYNIALMRQLVKNGSDKYPGANFVVSRSGNMRKYLLFDKNRANTAKNLRIGDIVERHMIDNDVCLFNRQPSLHKVSIMAHFAKVGSHRTFRFNECVCNPYNADFDGDEMNVHLPQTEEAKAEALVLMGTKSNIVTPRNGAPLISAIQDFITAAYLLTKKDTFLSRTEATRLIGAMIALDDTKTELTLPMPAVMKPQTLWTGKQIFSLILRPGKKSKVFVCLEAKGRQYTNKDKEFCLNDSYVIIRNSQLLAGHMDKATLGSESHTNIFYILLCDYGKNVAAEAMWRLARVCPLFLSDRGFSMGIGDVAPGLELNLEKQQLLKHGYSLCNSYIHDQKQGNLQANTGLSVEETLEAKILCELSKIRESAGISCKKMLNYTNTPLTMALCGSKGSFINISQMIACVGQQAILGKRVPCGLDDRPLAHYPVLSKTPKAGGFVASSFYSGLESTEFFFHTMAGREGLVDTAVKTSETGYIQRRLIKFLEDLFVAYDGTVRSSDNSVVQFVYGNDGLDPSWMEGGDSKPIDLDRIVSLAKINHPCAGKAGLKVNEIIQTTKKRLADAKLLSQDFKLSVNQYIMEYVNKMMVRETSYGELIIDRSSPVPEEDRLTKTQLEKFLNVVTSKYERAIIEPGTSVGALCAQSIGEPGTQMTLKTFHFAGVASCNITQGVPRIKEIINAAVTISTPVIKAHLDKANSEEEARRTKGRIEKMTVGDVMKHFSTRYLPTGPILFLAINLHLCKLHKLNVTIHSIANSIMAALPVIKLLNVSVVSDSALAISPTEKSKTSIDKLIRLLEENIPEVVICGLKESKRVIIHKERGQYSLLVEGTGLAQVMITYGVNGKKTSSNSTMEVEKVLGIEAARATIVEQMRLCMASHGIKIDARHLLLLADAMTYTGRVHGATRHGMDKFKQSALMLASFEKTAEHLFDAAYMGQRDEIRGVSESIIVGAPVAVGTGAFGLLHAHAAEQLTLPLARRELVFDRPELHHPRF